MGYSSVDRTPRSLGYRTGRWLWQNSARLYFESWVGQSGLAQVRSASYVLGRRERPFGRDAFRMSDMMFVPFSSLPVRHRPVLLARGNGVDECS